jgi:flagellar motor switch/type III secretory pathway protein FliN
MQAAVSVLAGDDENVQAIIRFGPDELSRLQTSLVSTWETWCTQWRLGPGDVQVAHLVDSFGPAPAWADSSQALGAAGSGNAARIHGHEAVVAQVIGNPARAPSAIEAEVRAQANAALLTLCCDALRLTPASSVPYSAKPKRPQLGDLHLRLRLQGNERVQPQELQIWLPQHAALALLRSQSARVPGKRTTATRAPVLAPMSEALSGTPIKVGITLSPVQLSLGAIAELQLGDVIKLDHALTSPLFAALISQTSGKAEVTPLARVHLGREGQQLAVQLDAGKRATSA